MFAHAEVTRGHGSRPIRWTPSRRPGCEVDCADDGLEPVVRGCAKAPPRRPSTCLWPAWYRWSKWGRSGMSNRCRAHRWRTGSTRGAGPVRRVRGHDCDPMSPGPPLPQPLTRLTLELRAIATARLRTRRRRPGVGVLTWLINLRLPGRLPRLINQVNTPIEYMC